MSFLSSILEGIGNIFSSAVNTFTYMWVMDEPDCPNNLIK